MTVSNDLYKQMLSTLEYPQPPAGFAAILINVGATEPMVIHIDMHDGEEKNFTIKDGRISFRLSSEPTFEELVSPLDSLQPKKEFFPNTPEGRVRNNKMIMDLLFGNKKIQAIKEVRSQEQMGLKEAKDLCDKIFAAGPAVLT